MLKLTLNSLIFYETCELCYSRRMLALIEFAFHIAILIWQVAIKIISTASAPEVYVTKFLPREVSTMNRCYRHANVVSQMVYSFV